MDHEDVGLVRKVRGVLERAKQNRLLLFEGSYVGGGDLPTFRWSRINPDAEGFLDFALQLNAKVLFYSLYFFTERDIEECRMELDAIRDHLEDLDLGDSQLKKYRGRLFHYLARLNGFQEHLGEVGEVVLQVKVDGDLYEYVEDEKWYEEFTLLLDEVRSLHEELDQDSEELGDEDVDE